VVGLAACGRVPLTEQELPTAPVTIGGAGAPGASDVSDASAAGNTASPEPSDAAPVAELDAPVEAAVEAPFDAPSEPASVVRDLGGEPDTDAVACTKYAKRCADEMHAQWCEHDTWSDPAYCNYGCENGVCVNSCRPGGTRCASPTEIQTCDQDRTWGAVATCPNGCSGYRCRCGDGGCG
jgi:hypothetical protein